MKKSIIIIIIIISLTVLVSALYYPEDDNPGDYIAEIFQEMLDEKTAAIDNWENKANWSIALTILVGISGIVAGTVHRINANWSKHLTLVAGLSVAVITVITNTLFTVDHNTIKAVVQDGRQLVDEVQLELITLRHNTSDRKTVENEIRKKLKLLNELGKLVYNEAPSGFNLLNLFPAVYAQQQTLQAPIWANAPPQDDFSLYFVGEGRDSLLAKAKEKSQSQAQSNTNFYLLDQFSSVRTRIETSIDDTALVKNLIESADFDVTNTYFTYDSASAEYTYYTILQLDRSLLEFDLKLYQRRNKVLVPDQYFNMLRNISQEQEQYQDHEQD